MSTYLETVMPRFLDLLRKVKLNAEADEEAVQSLAKIEKVLEKVKAMDLLRWLKGLDQTDHGEIGNNVLRELKLLLQTLLYRGSCLELELNDINLEAIKKALLSQLPPIVEKIDHLMTLVHMPEPEKQSGVDNAREMSQEPSTLGLEDMFDKSEVVANIRGSYEDLDCTRVARFGLSSSISSLDFFQAQTAHILQNQSLQMSTYLEGVMPRFLDLLRKAKLISEAADEAVQSLAKIEKVLEKVKAMDLLKWLKGLDQTDHGKIGNNVLRELKLLLQTLLYRGSCLELELNDINLEVIKKVLLSQLPPIVEKIDHLMTLVRMPEPEKQSGVDNAQEMSQEPSTLGLEDMFDRSDVMANIRRSYEDLESTELKVCFLSFSIFPENSAIKKRPLIYWWIGEGFITSTKDKRAEEMGEEIFEKLMRKDLIQADSGEPNCELLVKSCTMHPWIRRMLISLAREANLFHFDSVWPMMPSYTVETSTCRRACFVSGSDVPQGAGSDALLTVFNVNVQYLSLEQAWLEKLKKVEVLQLGRWQNSATYHIEVEHRRFVGSSAEGILNGLGAQKHLKYLSLRGISRITRLPDSILRLISLEILDLRACHDLERLPSDISSLKKLTHLDVSECYLLEGMPKGIQKLKSLQVLKGFLIGSVEKTPCRLGELAKLKNLRRLSIHMGNEAAVHEGEFKKLKESSSLRRLKISWGVVSETLKKDIMSKSKELLFPPNLEKLDLQGYPQRDAPDGLKPSQLNKLKQLYIMGGELASLDHGETTDQWRVEIVRLHFLTISKIELARLKQLFPRLQYWAVS